MKLLAVLALLPAAVLADLAITQPVASTVWTAGTTATVLWIPAPPASGGNGQFDPTVDHNIDLMRGDAQALVLVASAPARVRETAGRAELALPRDVPAGSDYVVRVGQRYSARFVIKAAGAAPHNGTTHGGKNATVPSTNGTTNATSGTSKLDHPSHFGLAVLSLAALTLA